MSFKCSVKNRLGTAFGGLQAVLMTLFLLYAATPTALAVPGSELSSEELLQKAANPKQPEAVRQNAFLALVDRGATNYTTVINSAQSEQSDPGQRWIAIRVLGKLGGPEAETVLVRLLRNSKVDTRTAAASALGDTGNQRYVTVLSDRLEDEAIIVRASAAEALGKLASAKAIPALDKALVSDSNHYRGSSLWVRRHYVAALKEIAHKDAYGTLLRCLDDVDPSVLAGAVLALEATAGFTMSEGRTEAQEIEAWRRWLANQLQK